jgi:hypothetical protein
VRALEYKGRQSVVLSKGRNLDPEDRELQIKLAQLNAKLQFDLTGAFGLLAAALVWLVFACQIGKENFDSVVIWIAGFASILFAIRYGRRARACPDEFEELK